MSNIWRGLGLKYFQTTELAWKATRKLSPATRLLYGDLSMLAQRFSRVELTIPAGELAEYIQPRRLKKAIAEMEKNRLVSTAHRKRDAHYTFRFLDPETGEPIPTLKERRIKEGDATPEQIAGYVLYRLLRLEPKIQEGIVTSRCPFHGGNGHSFTIDTLTGVWGCSKPDCRQGEDIISLEVDIAAQRWNDITRKTAWKRIVSAFRMAERQKITAVFSASITDKLSDIKTSDFCFNGQIVRHRKNPSGFSENANRQ